jgi:hypothetical protein
VDWQQDFSRGRNYQQQKLVSNLAVTEDHSLIAWVSGGTEYMRKNLFAVGLIVISMIFVGCTTPTHALLDSENQIKLRSIQSRRFDLNDKEKVLRTALATAQDLGFVTL